MKQIKNSTLCYYCLGCNRQEDFDYKTQKRCADFIAGVEDWQDKFREGLKNEQIQKQKG